MYNVHSLIEEQNFCLFYILNRKLGYTIGYKDFDFFHKMGTIADKSPYLYRYEQRNLLPNMVESVLRYHLFIFFRDNGHLVMRGGLLVCVYDKSFFLVLRVLQ